MDPYTLDASASPLLDPHAPSSEPSEGLGKRAYAQPALKMCGSVPAITGGSDIFGDMDDDMTP